MNQVADVVVRELLRHGVTVYRNRPEMTLREVIEDSNAKKPDYHFAIHSNATGMDESEIRGAEIYCCSFGGKGEEMARNIYKHLEALTPVIDRGIKTNNHLYELNSTYAPAALVEIEYHDSAEGAKWIMENIEPIGIALTKGLLETVGVAWIEPDPVAAAIEKLTALGDIKTQAYWLENARPGKVVDGEYVGLLLTRIAKRL
jgi:N-acetylmuramoyl-L-alanine amidase